MSVAFIDQHRETYGVEPICRVLAIAPSTFFRHKRLQRDPSRRCARAQEDDVLRAIIRRIWNEHHQVYGSRKVWRQMALEQAIYNQCGSARDGLIDHSDHGTQYLSMRYTDRLAEAGIAPSVGSRGDSSGPQDSFDASQAAS